MSITDKKPKLDIAIIIRGEAKTGKTSLAYLLQKLLANIGTTVTVDDNGDPEPFSASDDPGFMKWYNAQQLIANTRVTITTETIVRPMLLQAPIDPKVAIEALRIVEERTAETGGVQP